MVFTPGNYVNTRISKVEENHLGEGPMIHTTKAFGLSNQIGSTPAIWPFNHRLNPDWRWQFC